ncbi:MAG TPA: hypothetical protein VEV42_15900 [Pyrinomonadaceae bacterium]|nr:hypothetical protein [Pyrinomonadaceae bacterium]
MAVADSLSVDENTARYKPERWQLAQWATSKRKFKFLAATGSEA